MPIGRLDHYARVMAETERGNEMENVEREDLTILGCDCYRLKAENERLKEHNRNLEDRVMRFSQTLAIASMAMIDGSKEAYLDAIAKIREVMGAGNE